MTSVDDDYLVPDEVNLDELSKSNAENFAKNSLAQYVRSSVGDVINRALLLQRHSSLHSTVLSSIVFDLNDLSTFTINAGFGVQEYMIDKLFEQGLNGTECDRDAVLAVFAVLLDDLRFQHLRPHVFNYLTNILLTKILTPEELIAGVNKKPGVAKLYYLRATLPKLEADWQRLLRATEICAFLFLKRILDADWKFLPRLIDEVILRLACPPTLYSFYAVCSIFTTVKEKRFVWGGARSPLFEPTLLENAYRKLADFLLQYRFAHTEDWETITFAHGVLMRAFKEMKNWDVVLRSRYSKFTRNEPVPTRAHSSRELYWLIIERHYGKVYHLGLKINRRLFAQPGAPKYYPGKSSHREDTGKGHWSQQIQEITSLRQQGLLLLSNPFVT